ncbi:MAG: hypothetical protein HGA45_35085 [Chloroflexales bacterium]|nr:hypothetical protein [Chloroflexales bacterium]
MHSARNPFSLEVFVSPERLTALDVALATALTAAGVGHILLTPVYYRHESPLNQAWFAGSGLALAFLGMLNLARVQSDDATVRGLSKLANPAGTVFLAIVAARLREPQTLAALAVNAGLTALALRK